MPDAGPDPHGATADCSVTWGLMGICAMKWTREVSRDTHDCVCQHITALGGRSRGAPPPPPALHRRVHPVGATTAQDAALATMLSSCVSPCSPSSPCSRSVRPARSAALAVRETRRRRACRAGSGPSTGRARSCGRSWPRPLPTGSGTAASTWVPWRTSFPWSPSRAAPCTSLASSSTGPSSRCGRGRFSPPSNRSSRSCRPVTRWRPAMSSARCRRGTALAPACTSGSESRASTSLRCCFSAACAARCCCRPWRQARGWAVRYTAARRSALTWV